MIQQSHRYEINNISRLIIVPCIKNRDVKTHEGWNIAIINKWYIYIIVLNNLRTN